MRIRTAWLRRASAAFLGGTLLVGSAWAGTGLGPAPTSGTAPGTSPTRANPKDVAQGNQAVRGLSAPADPLTPPNLNGLRTAPQLEGGLFYVGADVTSVAPRSPQWKTSGCSVNGMGGGDEVSGILARLQAGEAPPGWPKSDDCIYLGGYGIGPNRPATGVDPHAGIHVRSLAISNGRDFVVWQMVDMVGFFARYRSELCNPGCGILDIRRVVSGGTGIPLANLAVGSTHTHGGADGYGAWGGLPDWYRAQLRDDIVASAYNALRNLKVAALETGQVDARGFNNERRSQYYSSPDYDLGWLRAIAVDPDGTDGATIATLVNYGGHPTVLGSSNTLLHGDWPATASKAIGEAVGGVGLVFEGGLGNLSPSRPRDAAADITGDGKRDRLDDVIQHGIDFADYVARDVRRGGHRMTTSTVKASTRAVTHPITNMAENGLAFAGLLDREFTPGTDGADGPGAFAAGKNAIRPCTSASPVQIKTEVSGYRVGDLTVVTGPGELFSTITEAAKSRSGRSSAFAGSHAMVFAQTQDALGYIIQSFEVDAGGGVLTNVPGKPVEYEETFMLDRCFGDAVILAQLGVSASLG